MLNELDATAIFEEEVFAGQLNQTGDVFTREWYFNITNFTRNIDYWYQVTPRLDEPDELMEWKTKGWLQNKVEHEDFFEMPV